jgi:hypothetical protein
MSVSHPRPLSLPMKELPRTQSIGGWAGRCGEVENHSPVGNQTPAAQPIAIQTFSCGCSGGNLCGAVVYHAITRFHSSHSFHETKWTDANES